MNWHGYVLLEVDNTHPQSEIDEALTVVALAGISPTTDKAHEKSSVRKSLDGSKYIWEVTMVDEIIPSLAYVRNGIVKHTAILQADADALVTGLTVLGDDTDTKTYIKANIAEWQPPEPGL